MEEQLVSLKIAKLLKEKGFDEPCHNYYVKPFKDDTIRLFYSNDVLLQNSMLFCIALAPTQSLAQKWLREKHNIEAGIGYHYFAQAGKISYSMIVIYDNYMTYENVGNFTSPEEALEQAILKALKLIK